MKKGSTAEDDTICRPSNHFHNPLKPWYQSQQSDFSLTNWVCGTPYSNVTWGTGYQAPAPTGPWISTGNTMDWAAARRFYLQALTSGASTDRETSFANAFQAIGQVMHLLEDMAVPAHVRNDFTSHLYLINVGLSSPRTWPGNPFEKYVKDHPESISGSETIDNVTNVPVTRFWDTDSYTGDNPSTSLSQGLAEYTNANFFSETTIFTENKDASNVHYFPHPAKNETDANHIEEVVAEDGNIDTRRYVYKADTGINLAAYAYFNGEWAAQSGVYWPAGISEGWNYTLDDDIYKGYAGLLLPRAVGYSAGLLNYFFRGEMDMREDPDNTGQFVIDNKTGEIMSGTFTLYYDYEEGTDIKRKVVTSWDLTEENGKAISGNGKSESLPSFTPPTYPAPKEKDKYTLVFQGKLGNEEDAVAGKVVYLKPLGGYIKITEVKRTGKCYGMYGNSDDKWDVTFSLEGGYLEDSVVEVPKWYGGNYSYSQPVTVNTDIDSDINRDPGLIMRWILSDGRTVDSYNTYSLNQIPKAFVVYTAYSEVWTLAELGYDLKTYLHYFDRYGWTFPVYHKPVNQTDGSCWDLSNPPKESGEVYMWPGTIKGFYRMGDAGRFVGQSYGLWNKKLISAFGYSQEEIDSLPKFSNQGIASGGLYRYEIGTSNLYLISIKPNVYVGTYSKNICTRDIEYNVIDEIPFPDFGNDEVLYYIYYIGSGQDYPWTLKLIAE